MDATQLLTRGNRPLQAKTLEARPAIGQVRFGCSNKISAPSADSVSSINTLAGLSFITYIVVIG